MSSGSVRFHPRIVRAVRARARDAARGSAVSSHAASAPPAGAPVPVSGTAPGRASVVARQVSWWAAAQWGVAQWPVVRACRVVPVPVVVNVPVSSAVAADAVPVAGPLVLKGTHRRRERCAGRRQASLGGEVIGTSGWVEGDGRGVVAVG